jgi:transcriptional regulator with XRE-family HTH domain
MSVVGENISKYRKNRHLKQEELGERIGKGKSVISHWERGHNDPSVSCIFLLCEALNVDPNQLFGWAERGLATNEALLLEFYRRLNEEGQDSLTHTAEGLTAVAEYKKDYQSELVEVGA